MWKTGTSKKLLGVVALSLTLTVAACGGGKGAPGGSTSAPKGSGDVPTSVKGTVHVLMEGVPDTDIVKSLVPQFNKKYPNVKVEIDTAVYDQMRDKYVASFTAPSPQYDLAIIDNPWMGDFAKAGFLKPLDSYIKTTPGYDYQDFAAPLRAIDEVDGKSYGVPFYNYALGLIYRKDLLPTAPTTLAGLAADAKKLTTSSRAGIAMQPQRGYKAFEEWGNYLMAAGGTIYGSDGKVHIDTAEGRKALQTYIDMYHSSAPKDSLNWAFDEALRSVSSDKSAMMVSYNWMLPTLNNPDGPAGDLAGKFALAPMPGGAQVLGSWSWAIPANATADQADWAFVSWLTSKEGETQRVLAGGAPVRTSVLSDPKVLASGSGAAYFQAVAKILQNASPLCQGANCDEMITAVGTQLNAAVAGQKSVADALAAAEEQANRIQSS
jgi:multiple sugar transport system substrate-binding protein